MYRIILASESPRRKNIMEIMGIPFVAMASDVLEEIKGAGKEYEPSEIVQGLARLKAEDINSKFSSNILNNIQNNKEAAVDEGYIIIGADTMVFYKGQALGKPKNKSEAIRMLELIEGDTHEVYTGVYIIIRSNEMHNITDTNYTSLSFAVSTKVKLMPLTRQQIEDYVATGESNDKAGAYGIQGRFGIFIQEIVGDYYNVVGFPIAAIYENLLTYGIDLKKKY